MSRRDFGWILVGILSGLWTAYGTLASGGFEFSSPSVSRAIANVFGAVLFMFVIGRIVQRFR